MKRVFVAKSNGVKQVEVSQPEDEEKAGGSSSKKKPLNPQVESLQRTSTGLDPIKKSSGLGAPPACNLSPFLR